MSQRRVGATMLVGNTEKYAGAYRKSRKRPKLLRFDIRYRCRRLHEVLGRLGIDLAGKRVMEFGFGGGELLKTFPPSCSLTGVELSPAAIELASSDRDYLPYRSASFHLVAEQRPEQMPDGPYDVIVASHVLEHCYDERETLRQFRSRLAPGGILIVFVPIEEPDYILFHVQNYSLQSIQRAIFLAGFVVLTSEGSMYVNGHVWKLLTIPSRRQWPVFKQVADTLRLGTLSLIPYRLLLLLDRLLFYLGFGARQALVIARKDEDPAATAAAARRAG